MTLSIVAFMPMRHSSERVPGKNYRDFNGQPLFHHVVSALLAVPQITTVVIDTDSPTIVEQCAEHFPEVRCIDRPEHLLPISESLVPADSFNQSAAPPGDDRTSDRRARGPPGRK